MSKAEILVTGFEPFDRWSVNSSWEAVRRLHLRGGMVRVACLPVDHHKAARRVCGLIAALRPRAVLLTGLADRTQPSFEASARLGPEGGEDRDPIRPARWPIAPAIDAMSTMGLPCHLSDDAGRYVCETTFWAALGTGVRQVGFLHLPPIGPDCSAARLSLALETALDCVA